MCETTIHADGGTTTVCRRSNLAGLGPSVVNDERPSRFHECDASRLTVVANERAERLAQRIGEARRAVLAGLPSSVVLSILDGKSGNA